MKNTAEYNRKYYYKRRQAIFDYLGNACVICGSNQDLEIDHKDKSEKSFNIGLRLSVKNNKKELDKCQILCSICHNQKTSKENKGFTHGTIYAWMNKKCNCAECYKVKRKWYRIRNIKRRIGKAYKERF